MTLSKDCVLREKVKQSNSLKQSEIALNLHRRKHHSTHIETVWAQKSRGKWKMEQERNQCEAPSNGKRQWRTPQMEVILVAGHSAGFGGGSNEGKATLATAEVGSSAGRRVTTTVVVAASS